MSAISDVCLLDAVEMARCVRAKDLWAQEVVRPLLAQIERVNPTVNTVVTLGAGSQTFNEVFGQRRCLRVLPLER